VNVFGNIFLKRRKMFKNKFLKLYIGVLFLVTLSFSSCEKEIPIWYSNGLKTAFYQLKEAALEYAPSKEFPRALHKDGSIRFEPAKGWTSGFFPGNLWLMYGMSHNNEFKIVAEQYSELLDGQQYETFTHDVGFKMFCSLGTSLRYTENKKYQKDLVAAANSLKSRYNSEIGVIRSWDFGEWQYPVIVDNLMNLELLFWASKYTNDEIYKKIAITHAETTIKNHFRKDYSSFHVVEYDTITAKPISKETFQGYSDSSSWARGQAWALYGFTMAYKETNKKEFLDQAENIAAYIIPQLKKNKDKIPFWDFSSPDIPNTVRDASAGAIIASAFLELQKFSDKGALYVQHAEEILKSLSSKQYLAEKGTNKLFILKHSTGSLPHDSEVDVPIIYADYYYLEAMERYGKIKNIDMKQIFN